MHAVVCALPFVELQYVKHLPAPTSLLVSQYLLLAEHLCTASPAAFVPQMHSPEFSAVPFVLPHAPTAWQRAFALFVVTLATQYFWLAVPSQ
jgi:hypothetical protein